jgi:hypothetical protein
MSWFKLTVPKGKRKKRAHKKWLVKTGVRDYLLEVQKRIEAEIDIEAFQREVCGAFADATVYGIGIVDMPHGGEPRCIRYEELTQGHELGDIGAVKALKELLT